MLLLPVASVSCCNEAGRRQFVNMLAHFSSHFTGRKTVQTGQVSLDVSIAHVANTNEKNEVVSWLSIEPQSVLQPSRLGLLHETIYSYRPHHPLMIAPTKYGRFL